MCPKSNFVRPLFDLCANPPDLRANPPGNLSLERSPIPAPRLRAAHVSNWFRQALMHATFRVAC